MIVLESGRPVAALTMGVVPAAIAAYPSSAISPSSSEYAGNADMFRLITLRPPEASTPVTECGYKNSARAEPKASVANCSWLLALSSSPSAGAGELVNLVFAASKIVPQPPSLAGRYTTATAITR